MVPKTSKTTCEVPNSCVARAVSTSLATQSSFASTPTVYRSHGGIMSTVSCTVLLTCSFASAASSCIFFAFPPAALPQTEAPG